MSSKKLFDEDSEEEEVTFKTENEYAKKYDNWREKEELHKLEQKYGSKPLTEDSSISSDSEDDDDEPPEVSEEVETQFLKTLALLKTKDPRIYDSSFKAFEDTEEKKEEIKSAAKILTFEDSDDSDSGDDGNIFKVEKKAEIGTETEKKAGGDDKKMDKETKVREYLTGKVEHIDDEVEQDLAPLKALWSDPKLNEGEAFLRDYILNKRYLDDGDLGDAEDKLRDDEDLEEDERRVEEQGKFERAYNFRFEEPDDEFLKRYPRTMNYTRPKDDRRSKKRAEVRTRKEQEKQKKMEEIARLKALKLKEIQEKIAKIKEVTGNQDLAFKEDDIEGDFDPEEHDRRMKALFDEEFYGEADVEKPVFPDLDEELEIENWDKYEPEVDRQESMQYDNNDDGPYCEDEDFNMDADYDPKLAKAKLVEEIQSTLGKKRRNRKKKSKLADLLATDKPKYIPQVADKTYDQYMEEYYKMDCEDVIGGDLPTRFKYREVVPNDFGLSIEEILLADDKELTQWVPLKKIVKHRPRDVEKSEINTYKQKAADVSLKKKILPSLFKDLPEEPELVVPIEEATKKKKKKKNKDKKTEEQTGQDTQENESDTVYSEINGDTEDTTEIKSKKKKKKHKEIVENTGETNAEVVSDDNKMKHKEKHKDLDILEVNVEGNENKRKDSESSVVDKDSTEVKRKKRNKNKNKNKQNIADDKTSNNVQTAQNNDQKVKTVTNEVHSQVTETRKTKNKKKNNDKLNSFVVENVQKQAPSHTGQEGIKKDKVNLKRKLDQTDQGPNKKQKKFDNNKNKINKGKNKFKQFKNNKSKDQSSDNPLNKLSDERLKAYGLNPKKYRSFLKYKKH